MTPEIDFAKLRQVSEWENYVLLTDGKRMLTVIVDKPAEGETYDELYERKCHHFNNVCEALAKYRVAPFLIDDDEEESL